MIPNGNYPSMPAALKRKQARMYLDDTDENRLAALVKAIPVLSEAMIMSAILSAGLHACTKDGNRLPLPLEFEIVDPNASALQLNDSPVKPKTRK